MSNFLLGGSAIWDGVMMFSPYGYAIACRKGEDVVVYKEVFQVNDIPSQSGLLSRIPFLRGIFAFILSLGLSIRAHIIANKISTVGYDSNRVDSSFDRTLLIKLIANVFLSFVVFLLIPDLLSRILFSSIVLMSLAEVILRIVLLIIYISVLSWFPAGKRLLQYHGAEHKTINAFEKGALMVPEEVGIYPRFHSRCGTTLFALVLLLLFFVYLPLQAFPFPTRILLKFMVLPFILPIAFELVYLGLRYKRFSVLLVPGLLLQLITTKSPSKEQIEVAITALKEVAPFA